MHSHAQTDAIMRSKLVVMDKSRTKERWLGMPGIERTKRGRFRKDPALKIPLDI